MIVPVPNAQRYLRIQISLASRRTRRSALIGHELRHALEVAEAPDVRDQTGADGRSIARIGEPAGACTRYDTRAAQQRRAAGPERADRMSVGRRRAPPSTIQPSLRSIRGGRNQRSVPTPFGGSISKSMRQMPPFLNSSGVRAPISRAASSPMFGSWPTSAIRPPCAVLGEFLDHRGGRARRRQRVAGASPAAWPSALRRRRRRSAACAPAGSQTMRSKPTSSASSALRCLAQPRDAFARQRPLRVVRILVAALRGNAVANQIQLESRPSSQRFPAAASAAVRGRRGAGAAQAAPS